MHQRRHQKGGKRSRGGRGRGGGGRGRGNTKARGARAEIARATLEVIEKGHYVYSGKKVDIKETMNRAVEKTKLFASNPSLSASLPTFKTEITVTLETTLSALFRIAQTQPEPDSKLEDIDAKSLMTSSGSPPNVTPFVLNFASARNPGGGFEKGSQAQEESLARASGLYPCLITQMSSFYHPHRRSHDPFYSSKVIYSPSVPIFRDDDGKFLSKPVLASFGTTAAVNAGTVMRAIDTKNTNIVQQANKQIEKENHTRMRRVLSVALANGHQDLVLGAFGCGVFRNNPQDIAKIWKSLLNSAEFKNKFRRICFAIYDTSKSLSVLSAFLKELGE
ncbi:hypothetical protein AAMO2058_001609700 [Amorphochlora amoebiformis]